MHPWNLLSQYPAVRRGFLISKTGNLRKAYNKNKQANPSPLLKGGGGEADGGLPPAAPALKAYYIAQRKLMANFSLATKLYYLSSLVFKVYEMFINPLLQS